MTKLTSTVAALGVVLLGATTAASAQTAPPSPARSALGDWLYDSTECCPGSIGGPGRSGAGTD